MVCASFLSPESARSPRRRDRGRSRPPSTPRCPIDRALGATRRDRGQTGRSRNRPPREGDARCRRASDRRRASSCAVITVLRASLVNRSNIAISRTSYGRPVSTRRGRPRSVARSSRGPAPSSPGPAPACRPDDEGRPQVEDPQCQPTLTSRCKSLTPSRRLARYQPARRVSDSRNRARAPSPSGSKRGSLVWPRSHRM